MAEKYGLMSKTDNNYNSASIIIKDQISEVDVFLQFSANYYNRDNDIFPNKVDFVFKTSIEERTKYDLYYIENWSLLLDIKILIKTVFEFMFHKNAY